MDKKEAHKLARKELGKEIKEMRKAMGFTQRTFVDYYNALDPTGLTMTRSDLSHFEIGRTNIPAIKYKKMLLMAISYESEE